MAITIILITIIVIISLIYLDNNSTLNYDATKYKIANICCYLGVIMIMLLSIIAIGNQRSINDSFAEEDARLSEITIQRDSLTTKELVYRKLLREQQTEMINTLCTHVTLTADELNLLYKVNALEAKVDSIEYIKENL